MWLWLIELLQCPACHGRLEWLLKARSEGRLEEGEARCGDRGAVYEVREGIGLFLTPDLPRNDLWESSESGLATFLREHPDVADRLLNSPVQSLCPADQFLRASVLSERGDFQAADEIFPRAHAGLYTPEYVAAMDSQIESIISRLSGGRGPVVDLASGTCGLVTPMARRLTRLIVATDFSPRVLRRDRLRFEALGLADRVSFLAFDARRTPFKDRAMETMTTYYGLANIEQPGHLLRELRRVVSGTFLAATNFCPEDDPVNGPLLRQFGLETMMFRRLALEAFAAAGWSVETTGTRATPAAPTPASELIPGARADAFPAAPTTLEMTVLVAR